MKETEIVLSNGTKKVIKNIVMSEGTQKLLLVGAGIGAGIGLYVGIGKVASAVARRIETHKTNVKIGVVNYKNKKGHSVDFTVLELDKTDN